MASIYWHKQDAGKPLFPDMLWGKPENKQHAGKLLVVGGNEHEFSSPAEAYNEATTAGIGVVKVLLPSALQKTVGTILENGEFAPSTKTGSFAKTALSEWLTLAEWTDSVLIAGDLGRNSETAVVLESFIAKYSGQITLIKDAIDYFSTQANKVVERPDTTLVLSLAQLQKIFSSTKQTHAITFSMTLSQLVESLHDFTIKYPCNIIVEHNGVILVSSEGQVSTTKLEPSETWRVRTSAHATVWWLQNPSKPFEALTTSLIDFI